MTHITLSSSDEIGEQMGAKSTLTKKFLVTLTAILFVLPGITYASPIDSFKRTAPNIADNAISKYGEMINIAALLHDYDEKLIASVIVVESEGNKNALSNRGAQGLMQLMPLTAKAMGAKDPKEPFQNILAGTRYLKQLERDYGFNHKEALVAYNMGPTRAKRWLSQYSPDESIYVQKVMHIYGVLNDKANIEDSVTASSTQPIVATGILTKPKSLTVLDVPETALTNKRSDIVEQ